MTTNDRPQGQNERIEPTMDDKNEPILDAQAGQAEDPDPALDVNNTPTSPGSGVRTANRLPQMLLFGFLAIVLGFMGLGLFGSDKPQIPEDKQTDVNTQANKPSHATTDTVDSLAGDRMGVIEQAKSDEPPPPPEPEPMPVAPQQQPMMASGPDPQAELEERFRQMKLAAFTAAVTSRSSVPSFSNGAMDNMNGTSARRPQTYDEYQSEMGRVQRQINELNNARPGSTDVTDLYRQRMAQMPGGGGAGMGGMSAVGYGDDSMSRPGGEHLLKEQPDEAKWTLDSNVHVPQTPYEVLTGTVIPAVLITGINSDLPGQMVAQVSQNVYDTAKGNHLIIPQGTRLIGQYSSSVAYGQERVLVAWNRLIFPDGKSLDIGSMPGATGAGYSGFEDKVNHHYFRVFGSAFLMSMITAGVVYSQDHNDRNNDDEYSASDAMAEQLANQMGQTAAQLIQRNLTIAPTIEIRPGFRFNVVVTKDMVFKKPYQSFDYR